QGGKCLCGAGAGGLSPSCAFAPTGRQTFPLRHWWKNDLPARSRARYPRSPQGGQNNGQPYQTGEHVVTGSRRYAASLLASLALLAGCSPGGESVASADLGPMAVHGNTSTFEISPVFLAARDYYPGPATVKMGGI